MYQSECISATASQWMLELIQEKSLSSFSSLSWVLPNPDTAFPLHPDNIKSHGATGWIVSQSARSEPIDHTQACHFFTNVLSSNKTFLVRLVAILSLGVITHAAPIGNQDEVTHHLDPGTVWRLLRRQWLKALRNPSLSSEVKAQPLPPPPP